MGNLSIKLIYPIGWIIKYCSSMESRTNQSGFSFTPSFLISFFYSAFANRNRRRKKINRPQKIPVPKYERNITFQNLFFITVLVISVANPDLVGGSTGRIRPPPLKNSCARH